MTLTLNDITEICREVYKKAGWDVSQFNEVISPEDQRRREMDRGLYDKYVVKRLDADPTGKHANCWYFTLDLEHDPYAYAALDQYANSCADKYPVLSFELKQKLKAFVMNNEIRTAREQAIALLNQQGYQVTKDGEIQT